MTLFAAFVLLLTSIVNQTPTLKIKVIETERVDSRSTLSVYIKPNFVINENDTLHLSFQFNLETIFWHQIIGNSQSEQIFFLTLQVHKYDDVYIKVNNSNIVIKLDKYNYHHFPEIKISSILPYYFSKTTDQIKYPEEEFYALTDSLSFPISITQIADKIGRISYELIIINQKNDTTLYLQNVFGKELQLSAQIIISLKSFTAGKYVAKINYLKNNEFVGSTSSPAFFVSGDIISSELKQYKEDSKWYSVFKIYTEEELNYIMFIAELISSPEEKNIYQKITSVEMKRHFMEFFWEKRENHSTQNFYTFLNTVKEINKLFGLRTLEGVSTDRGKVYLKYGVPDDRYVSNIMVEMKPYEVWYYNSIVGQGSGYFYFVDLNGVGDYKLIHSTVRNEVYNPLYLQRLGVDVDNYRK